METSISVIGCGWLGHPLAGRLVDRGWEVRGSTTTPEKIESLRADGIEAALLTLDPTPTGTDWTSLFESSTVVLNIPPPRGAETVRVAHRRQIESVRSAAANGRVDWVLFASSTGVYPRVEQIVREDDCPPGALDALSGPRRATGEALLEAEHLLMDAPEFDTTVVRLGGLYDGNRHPGRFLAGRTDLGRPNAPVNLLHREDAIGIFLALLDEDLRGDVFNACADAHPTRQTLYTRAAEVLGLDPPVFDEEDSTTGKTVSNEKLKAALGYVFTHPDPLQDLENRTD